MLYLLGVLGNEVPIFNVFRYITFRTGGAIMTALMVVFLFGPPLINQLRLRQGKGQPIRSDGPKSHLSKAGTPTMGGLMILLGVGVATILWANLANRLVWVVLAGAGNAVNLTDGLDGLAIVPVMIAAATFGVIAYLVGNRVFAEYLQIHFVPGAGELAVICGALVGAGLGFLWFNAPPAMIFMGDTGSLALGGALGTIAVATKHEIVLAIVGGLFVLETASVIVQVLSFKLTGKRVFRMAPLHHHFEQKGWAEATVVVRFWIIAVVLALIGLSTLKLR